MFNSFTYNRTNIFLSSKRVVRIAQRARTIHITIDTPFLEIATKKKCLACYIFICFPLSSPRRSHFPVPFISTCRGWLHSAPMCEDPARGEIRKRTTHNASVPLSKRKLLYHESSLPAWLKPKCGVELRRCNAQGVEIFGTSDTYILMNMHGMGRTSCAPV